MGTKDNRFAIKFWPVLGFIAGTIVAFDMSTGAEYSMLITVLISIGGGIAGALVLTAFMAIHYGIYRKNILPGDES